MLPDTETLCAAVCRRAREDALPSLRPVINGTGVVLHTNLGRACLSQRATNAVTAVARGYSTLEYDLAKGQRGSRHDHIETLVCQVTGAEAAMVVNNNAAAVLLILSAWARGARSSPPGGSWWRSAAPSGSRRSWSSAAAPSGRWGPPTRPTSGTTKTPSARRPGLLKVHTSNFKIMGFSQSVPLDELVALGHEKGLPVIEDLGSGSLVDLEQFGIHDEPTVQQSVKAGVDIISFSGDKLLGGPQAGIILGKAEYIRLLKRHPLARAMRVDKMTIAALRETLYAYTDEELARREIPVLAMLGAKPHQLREKAGVLCAMLRERAWGPGGAHPGPGGRRLRPHPAADAWAVAIDPGKLTWTGWRRSCGCGPAHYRPYYP